MRTARQGKEGGMARARQTTRRRGVAPRRSYRAARARGGPRLGEAIVAALRPDYVGLTLALLAVAVVPWLIPITDLVAAVVGFFVRWLGVGALPAVLVAVAIGMGLSRRMLPRSLVFWRRLTGVLVLGVVLLGLLSFYRPDWTAGNAHLDEVSAGGEIGKSLFSGALAVLSWLALSLAGTTLVAPRTMAALARRSPALWDALLALRLPELAWSLGTVAIGGLRWLFRRGDDEDMVPLDVGRSRARYGSDDGGGDTADGPGFRRIATLSRSVEAPALFASARPLSPLTLPDRPSPTHMADMAAPADTPTHSATGWELPAMDLLKPAGTREAAAMDNARRAELIVQTLGSFGVDARVVEISEGPTVTQFGVEPGWEVKTRAVQERDRDGRPILDRDGRPRVRTEEVSRTRVRVNQITSLANDLALALAAPSLRIEAPVPGKPIVGIEVPNHDASVVTLRSVLESPQFARLSARSRLGIALGQGVSGEPLVADLAKMPHLLIAGATGSGKSVCLNAIIASLLMRCSPEDIRFIMVDPKRVELTPFAMTPHLAFSRIIVDVDEVPGALAAVISEMEARYRKFAQLAVRNIEGYNRHPKVAEKLPYWVLVIDELADLMMAAPYEVEKQICRLAQLARATGIHLIVATQRPSVDVVTGLIKANFPTRIAFAVSSQVDSRTILDSVGAEKLLGRGDMLYMSTDSAQPRRIQGVYVSDQEIEALVQFWARAGVKHKPVIYDHLLEEARHAHDIEEAESRKDALFERAKDLALEHTRISTSMLQRRLRIGYPRAARLMDELEEEGIVGVAEGGASREVLVSAGSLEADVTWE
ncbi:MAG: DNA translocase FtsK [Dehalococcoidia bacterium]|nr:DNA translocase FtsK [Dehalococcoidia bacterium]